MVDHYEINIAKKDMVGRYIHWATVTISDYNEQAAVEKLEYLRSLFGDEFKISMTHWIARGEHKPAWD